MKKPKPKTRSCTVQTNFECLMLRFHKPSGIKGCFFTYKSNLVNLVELSKQYKVDLVLVRAKSVPVYTLRGLVEAINQNNPLEESGYELQLIQEFTETVCKKKAAPLKSHRQIITKMLEDGTIVSVKSLKSKFEIDNISLSESQIRRNLSAVIVELGRQGKEVECITFNRMKCYHLS